MKWFENYTKNTLNIIIICKIKKYHLLINNKAGDFFFIIIHNKKIFNINILTIIYNNNLLNKPVNNLKNYNYI